ncbi:MAG: hypothetical protein AB7O28_17645 [Vicinamibacterales bacterium]
MRRVPMGVAVVLAVAVSVACGKSPEEKAAEALKDAAESAAKAGAEMAKAGAAAADTASEAAAGEAGKGMEDFAKAMQGMAAALGGNNGKMSDPVSFRELQTAFPTVSGWTMGKPKGERMTAPVSFSQTEVRYTNGSNGRIDVKIVDSAFNQVLIAPWAMFLTAGYEKETDDGYEKSTTLSGNPGFEKWNSERKSGELNLVVAKRFLVTVEGDRVDDVKVLQDVAGKVDFAKLASLAAAAPAK